MELLSVSEVYFSGISIDKSEKFGILNHYSTNY
jgi:hypothetical protein